MYMRIMLLVVIPLYFSSIHICILYWPQIVSVCYFYFHIHIGTVLLSHGAVPGSKGKRSYYRI
jgi:hypothetical protein